MRKYTCPPLEGGSKSERSFTITLFSRLLKQLCLNNILELVHSERNCTAAQLANQSNIVLGNYNEENQDYNVIVKYMSLYIFFIYIDTF